MPLPLAPLTRQWSCGSGILLIVYGYSRAIQRLSTRCSSAARLNWWCQGARTNSSSCGTWEHPRGCIKTLSEHSDSVTCLQFNSTTLVTGCKDGFVRVWDLRSERFLQKLHAHAQGVNSLQFDSHKIVSGGEDNLVKLWQFCWHTRNLLNWYVLSIKFVLQNILSPQLCDCFMGLSRFHPVECVCCWLILLFEHNLLHYNENPWKEMKVVFCVASITWWKKAVEKNVVTRGGDEEDKQFCIKITLSCFAAAKA